MSDLHVTRKGQDLDDAEVRRRLAEVYRIVLEANRRAQTGGEVMVERVGEGKGTQSNKGES
jgi:hypothetical protein